MSKREKVKVYGSRFCYLYLITILVLYGVGPNSLFPFEISGRVLAVSLIVSFFISLILGRNQPKVKDKSQQISSKIFESLLVIYTVGALFIFSYYGGSEFSIDEQPLIYVVSIFYLTLISIKLFILYRKNNNEKE
ncbi:hypothetical protein EKG37_03755 [Robertmurraya yapensis]|uniref:Uncharacterized protein n=2 Tax=Bacillaceae TaxID=186817 RepID=A0A3S0IMI4_9BACI|nr:hypothetical protein [Bacillus yapensis]RTR35757.1 hypothetical protein EKG37_03755 [Bacillus yapensis]TKS98559.1 hypothetical protein FAR12_03755 [Bacillus yapensis]